MYNKRRGGTIITDVKRQTLSRQQSVLLTLIVLERGGGRHIESCDTNNLGKVHVL